MQTQIDAVSRAVGSIVAALDKENFKVNTHTGWETKVELHVSASRLLCAGLLPPELAVRGAERRPCNRPFNTCTSPQSYSHCFGLSGSGV